jgi:hypothetical protein
LASVAVVAAVLLSQAPPVSSAVSYRFAASQYADGLVAVRRWTLGGRNGSLFTETITASSASGNTLPVVFEEPIPVAITSNLHGVRFNPLPSTVVKADPVVEWKIRVPAHGTVTVGYQVTVAPDGATMARLTRWVKDFNTLAAALKIGPVQVRSLSLSPPAIQIAPGQTTQLTLSGLMSDGTSAAKAALSGVVWSTGNPAVATVNSRGVVTGNSPGETSVTAQVGDIRATMTVTVTSPTGTGIPGAQTVPSDVIGKVQGSAYNELSGPPYNFNVSVQEGPGASQNQQPGTVYATSPGPGTPLQQGGNIIIFVVPPSPPPSPTPTPSQSSPLPQ